jgi:6-pyruvoyl-tetrahydropterin synthase
MKRIHTEDEQMVIDFKELKKKGVDHYLCMVRKPDGKYLIPQVKSTAQGVSSYANRMYRKYGDGTTVEVNYGIIENDKFEVKTYCTYG